MGPRRRLALGLVLALRAAAQAPEYVTGDECLFCHRTKVANTWQQNPHATTIRPAEGAADHVLGARGHARDLRQSGYGKFALRSSDGSWDADKFANRCVGCHATAVDPKTRAFAASAVDCYACHGAADLNHSKDTSLMWLSRKHSADPRLVTSICAQCHLRGGASKSSGLPYANNFIVGADLFRDFQLGEPEPNPGDRHVYANVRDVLENGGAMTCMSCHQVHGDSAQKHRRVLTGPICLECHNETGPKKAVKAFVVHSKLCEY